MFPNQIVKLKKVPDAAQCRGIQIVKAIRAANHLSLKEAKELYDKVRDGSEVLLEAHALDPDALALLLKHYRCEVELIEKNPSYSNSENKRLLEEKVREAGGRIIWDGSSEKEPACSHRYSYWPVDGFARKCVKCGAVLEEVMVQEKFDGAVRR